MTAVGVSSNMKKTIALWVMVGISLSSTLLASPFPIAAQTIQKQKSGKKKTTKSLITNPVINLVETAPDVAPSATPKPAVVPTLVPVPVDQFEVTPSTQVSRATDTTLTIKSKQCPASNKFLEPDKVIVSDREQLKTDGLTITFPTPTEDDGRCKLTIVLTVSRDAVSKRDIDLALEGDKKTTIVLLITKEEPLPPKPIPPGLKKPEVDVMWRLVPQPIVKDNFGTRVGKLFYCLEVIIGNNSGYDLQIAAVGFQVGPLGDATKTMAELLKKSYKETDDVGVILLEAAQADARAATLKAIAAREEGLRNLKAELAALASGISKDPLKPTPEEMDAACAKDSECRALNTKMKDASRRADAAAKEAEIKDRGADEVSKAQRFTADALIGRRDDLAARSSVIYQSRIPTSSYRMTRGSLEHGQFWSVRNLTINTIRAFGPFLTGFTPYFRNINHQKNYSEMINIISNPLEKGFELVVPDETVSQLQRLDEQILRDGTIIQNNRQVVTHTFMPKDNLFEKSDKMRDDPLMVTLALGKLVLIGDQIDYVNRVTVTSGPSGEVKPPPTVNATGTETFVQDTKRAVTFTGTNLDGATVTSDNPEIHVDPPTANTTGSITVTVEATGQSTPGTQNLILRTTSGSPVTIPINVERPAPTIVEKDDKKISKSSDDKLITASLTEDLPYEIKVTGTYLQGATLTPLEKNGKKLLAPTLPVVQPDGKSLTATIIVPKETPEEIYEIEVRNDREANKKKPATFQVKVAAQGAPSIKNSLPLMKDSSGNAVIAKDGSGKVIVTNDSSGKLIVANPAKSQDITIKLAGENLNAAKVSITTDSNAVDKLEIVSPDAVNTKATELTVTIKVKPSATPTSGQPVDYALLLETSRGPAPFKLQLKPQPAATISSPTQPLAGRSGQPISLVIVGTDLQGARISLPAGWVVKTAAAVNLDGTQLTEEVTIPADAVPTGTTEKVFTLEVANSNTVAAKPTFQIKVTP
jgi:hypothetical protein